MIKKIDFGQLIESAGDAVIVADPAGLIIYWNKGAQAIFGYSQSDVMGKTLDLITPKQHQKRHWEGYAKTMQTGVTRYGSSVLRVPANHQDGHSISIAFTVTLLYSDHHDITGIAAIIRDETRQFMENKKLKQRINELEKSMSDALGKTLN